MAERHYRGRINAEGRLEWVELSPEDIEAERQLLLAAVRRENARFSEWCTAMAEQIRREGEAFALIAERRRG